MTIDRQATPPTHGRQRLKQSDPTEKEDSKPSNYKQIQRNGRGNGATKMAARKIQRVIEVKKGNKWEMTDTWTDVKEIYDSLAHDLIAKKINACTWIKSIKRTYHYDGYQTITVDYGNGVRAQYTVTAN